MGRTNMDIFIDALLSGKTDKIPDEYDWFAPLLVTGTAITTTSMAVRSVT